MKTITIIGINYYPEDTAIGLYTTQLAEFLKDNGYNIKIITGFPYYPAWKVKKEYKHRSWFLKENINDIEVFRYKQYVPKKPKFLKRIIHLLDFTIGSFINILKIKNTDLVLCIVPFTSTIILGKILSKFRRAKLWVHIQDFEFDAASESNIINKKSFLLRIFFKIESILLNHTDAISTISPSMLKKLQGKSKSNNPKYLLPNWVDLDKINPEIYTRHQYLSSNKFKILYSGNIGEKQDWNFFLKFIENLQNNDQIEIIVVGEGAKKNWLLNEISNYSNVNCYKPVIYNQLSDLLCSADLHILFQKDSVIDTVMPSKILAMMASETPSIITGNLKSEVNLIINKSKGGKYFESDDINGVISFVKELINDKNEVKHLGINARDYVAKNFTSQTVLNKFKESFDKLIQN